MIRRVVLLLLFSMMAIPWGGGRTWGDEKAVPQGIIVAPSESQLSLQIKTDFQVYSPNEALKLSIELSRDAYVYIYDINPAGRVTLLFPNGFSRDNFLKAGRHSLPDKPTYSFVVTEPLGVEALQALALLKPIPILTISAQSDLEKHPFPQLSRDPKAWKPQVKELIEIHVQSGEWAADWTQFLVAPAVAHLKILSRPQGALVYVNGELRGQSPLELELTPGRVHIALVKEGYQRWSKTILLENRASSELSIQLEPAPRPFFPSIVQPSDPDFSALSLGLNAGLNPEGTFSAGLELGLSPWISLGGSVSFTQDEVPEYFDLGRPQLFPHERVYDRGPETEAYLKLSLPLLALSLHAGAGVAIQEKVHIAAPGGDLIVSTLRPLVEIRPNGYLETESYVTFFGGIALRVGSNLLGLSVHNRRGWIVGLTLRF